MNRDEEMTLRQVLREVEVLRREQELEFQLRDTHLAEIKKDVEEMRDSQRWVLRAVMSELLVIVAGVITVVLTGGGPGG